jgi:HSP20 family protein
MAMETKEQERGLAKWQPLRELEKLNRGFEELFGQQFWPVSRRRFPSEEMVWAPAIEVIEKKDRFLIKAELPGIKEEDINVSISGDMLTIEGEKRMESETKKEDYYYSEASYGSFSRSVSLPSTIDASKISADCSDGVLEITLPKRPGVQTKKIAVSKRKTVGNGKTSKKS